MDFFNPDLFKGILSVSSFYIPCEHAWGIINLHPQITKTIRQLLRLWNLPGIFNKHFNIGKLVFQKPNRT